MNKTKGFGARCGGAAAGLILFLVSAGSQALLGQSFDIPNKKWGLSFGNSPEFTGLRFNSRDRQVRYIRGMNVTLWAPHQDNKDSKIDGISFGLIPGGGYLRGIQVGLLGVGAEKTMSGINIGGLGVGSGQKLVGLTICGFGAGSQEVVGLTIGGFAIGLVNIVRDNPRYLRVLPLMNTSFEK